MKGLSGKSVLVTGAGSGIGRATAIRLAEEGCRVALNYPDNPEKVCRTQADIERAGGEAFAVRADVSDPAAVDRMFEEILRGWGGLDILVNNAGIMTERPSHELSPEDLERVLAVNLKGTWYCTRRALRHFLDAGRAGVVTSISSVHERIPKPGSVHYAMSKAGLGNMTRTLALEYGEKGIRLNNVGPGAIRTPINADWVDDPAGRGRVERFIPLGRVGAPEQIAAAVAFLCSEDAAYITGQTLFVDGGLSLFPSFLEM